ncbi:electron transport complex subunit RsxC [Natranaerobius thermophilus]|uniref:Ion-translocating oxidoreductase complex subunit C n=1 Tax=Natranaerobius thermophilus (strain ATCC BAA-1301 / DSM 18059 / JW/NM-WN-LF) TaxID=457570 RepID=B2A679_NATTJ|nr:electron transport complex subunit RsxC [Natranaerobius thermophilus]ACB84090.1 electron transport complex, RnfABCDGE type, C subunit [Natranaerobius thermophilus JW/NM-WN-LF]
MANQTFPGGISPGHFKDTKDKPIESLELPKKVYIPMEQHIGAPCTPTVEVGDYVKTGQKIGESDKFVSAPVHASISGEVVDIVQYNHPLGNTSQTVVIESDGQDEPDYQDEEQTVNLDSFSAEEIKNVVKEAGIVGLGGATFPTHVKISPPEDKPIDTVLINGAECEPFLTSDHRLMVEQAEKIIFGLRAIMKAVNCDRGIIAIEDNKPDAVEAMNSLVTDDDSLEVMTFETKYPQGAEKQLIKAALDREVPSGGLPMDVGCVVNNTGTALAVADALRTNKPILERVVTISGPGIEQSGNFMVRLGTLASDLIEQLGGMGDQTRKIIMGGPMMGISQPNADFPVIKGTSGVLLLTDQEVQIFEERPCINCGRCVDSCPISLLPNLLGTFMEHERPDKAEDFNALDCIECGCCTYICPARRPLVHYIRVAKGEIMAKRQNK